MIEPLDRSRRDSTLFPSTGPRKPSSIAPWLDCEPCHSLPDGGGNRPTDPPPTSYPSVPQTRARPASERLLLRPVPR